MEIFWLSILGFLFAGYFVLGGYDYGVQMLLPLAGREEAARRRTLAAVGPYFFGNEVWLVGFAGVLFGAFPYLEGTLLSGAYPLIVALLVALAAGKTAMQLRGRTHSRVWDVLLTAGGLGSSIALGMLIGLLLTGVPLTGGHGFTLGAAELFHPFVLLAGLTMALIFAGHGGAFLALRARGQVGDLGRTWARRALAGAAGATLLTFVAGLATGVRPPNPVPVIVAALGLVVLLAAARAALTAGRPGLAFAATATAAALPVPAVGLATYPYALVSSVDERYSMPVTTAAADATTLETLTAFGVVIIPIILGYQAFLWWAFRGRTDLSYF